MARAAIIMDKINNGTGTIGMLINDKKLYEGLTESSVNLNALLLDLQQHPKRYFSVFGHDKTKKTKTPPPPPPTHTP
jgi:phospholipid/cholesterol/gamma-HCH transport system substrate-binding protein